jgi:hypothetical protein
MAVQFQVAHSQLVRGAGVLAGGPYDCAEGFDPASAHALHVAFVVGAAAVGGELRASAEALAGAGRIDPLEQPERRPGVAVLRRQGQHR